MKIGFVLDDGLDRGDGVQQYVLTLGEWFTAQGHEVHYLVGQTSRSDLTHVHSLSRNISVRFNGNQMTMPLPANKQRLSQLLSAEQFDVLHVQMPYSPFLAARIIQLAPAQTRIIGTFHILPYGRFQRWGARALMSCLHRSLKRFDCILAVSRPAQTFAKQLGLHSVVLPNVVNTTRFSQTVAQNEPDTIVFLGRLVPRKGCLELLRAFELVRQQLPQARLTVAGAGKQDRALANWVAQHNLQASVTFMGYIKEEDKPDILSRATLAVFPSLGGESFGIVLIEAMAARSGVVLGGNNPGYASVLDSTPKALFNPRDAESTAGLIIELLTSKRARKNLHDKQQALVRQFDVATVGAKLLSYYQGDKA